MDILVLWNGGQSTTGYEREVAVARVDGEWRVVRMGLAKVY